MNKYYVVELNPNSFVLHHPDGTCSYFNWEEFKAIEWFMCHRKWMNEIMNEIDLNEDNLTIDTPNARKEFIGLCIEEIDSNLEIYGEDSYDPDIEQIVFDVAQDNGYWRDDK